MSDKKLVTILNIVTSLELPPPSLANTTTYYDNLPVRETSGVLERIKSPNCVLVNLERIFICLLLRNNNIRGNNFMSIIIVTQQF